MSRLEPNLAGGVVPAHWRGGLDMAGNLTHRSQHNPVELVVLASSPALVALVAVLAWH